MASGSPTSNFMPLQPCNAKSDLSASRYSSWWAMRRGASLRTRSGANPAFRSDRPPRKCFFSLTRITSPARPVTTYKERAQLAMRRAGGARSNRRCHTLWQTPVSPKAIPVGAGLPAMGRRAAPTAQVDSWGSPSSVPVQLPSAPGCTSGIPPARPAGSAPAPAPSETPRRYAAANGTAAAGLSA